LDLENNPPVFVLKRPFSVGFAVALVLFVSDERPCQLPVAVEIRNWKLGGLKRKLIFKKGGEPIGVEITQGF